MHEDTNSRRPTDLDSTELISRYPDIPPHRDQDMVISRSRRPALGNVITQIVLTPDNKYRVEGPGWKLGATNRDQALAYARYGPPEGFEAIQERRDQIAEMEAKLLEATESYRQARIGVDTARDRRYAVIRLAAEAGMSRRAIAALTDMSHQRIDQIVSGS